MMKISCRSLFLGSVEIESLTGEVGLARAVDAIIPQTSLSAQACDQGVSRVRYAETLVRLVPGEGVTLTDVHRRLFFRRQFAEPTIVYAGIEPRKKEYVYWCTIPVSCLFMLRLGIRGVRTFGFHTNRRVHKTTKR
ncbi:unnamed protein product [Protopolystoma xenopodis]|uniref:Uncharacterized protein n=1 Tax=Protopolystoma xenopodis TaxID=117903 RepID=A0A448WVE2_9PLAT|nr:unnamed protein product [Protopolystoma xenopodis]